jgi:hypothetical protein
VTKAAIVALLLAEVFGCAFFGYILGIASASR